MKKTRMFYTPKTSSGFIRLKPGKSRVRQVIKTSPGTVPAIGKYPRAPSLLRLSSSRLQNQVLIPVRARLGAMGAHVGPDPAAKSGRVAQCCSSPCSSSCAEPITGLSPKSRGGAGICRDAQQELICRDEEGSEYCWASTFPPWASSGHKDPRGWLEVLLEGKKTLRFWG